MLLLRQTSSLRNNFSIRNSKSTKTLATGQISSVPSGNYFLIPEFINAWRLNQIIQFLTIVVQRISIIYSLISPKIWISHLSKPSESYQWPWPSMRSRREFQPQMRFFRNSDTLNYLQINSIVDVFQYSFFFYIHSMIPNQWFWLKKNKIFQKYKTIIGNDHFFSWKVA